MLDRNIDTTSATLLALPVENRIKYTEKLLDDLARSIWNDSLNERDKDNMLRISGKMLQSVNQAKGLALEILEED